MIYTAFAVIYVRVQSHTQTRRKTPDGIDYEITIDGKNGYATVAMTKYYDGTEEPTLPFNLGTHSIYFYAE